MPGLIQRVPTGLLDFLGLKATGQNPVVMPDELQASVDISRLYAAARWERLNTVTNSVNAVGFFPGTGTTFQVPAGELWWVDSFVVTGTTVAAVTSFRIRPGFISPGSTIYPIGLGPYAQTVAAGEKPGIAWQDFLLRSGDQLGLHCEAVTLGTAQTFELFLRVLRLTV